MEAPLGLLPIKKFLPRFPQLQPGRTALPAPLNLPGNRLSNRCLLSMMDFGPNPPYSKTCHREQPQERAIRLSLTALRSSERS
jgi:hypothetical protein